MNNREERCGHGRRLKETAARANDGKGDSKKYQNGILEAPWCPRWRLLGSSDGDVTKTATLAAR